ncbi:MAG TPA: hypothetical protein VFA96_10015, partial [Nocardioides sp.]|nr:hypothetical protein [Nocardioides sp.]
MPDVSCAQRRISNGKGFVEREKASALDDGTHRVRHPGLDFCLRQLPPPHGCSSARIGDDAPTGQDAHDR